ncbi:MAG TPA: hypothetical protein IAB06_04135 [Candidatus Avacidaminococcus intestinavium]|uniref:Uncharacterized protein n=1 Tax=Candidatus Avacidaminococcus intestinavium TaxID=2840684 RepID=A0A9D1MQE5_9FIRM|nr:hypothetical protein [Candidatus Avacidaminococcus intestinavium]
METVGKILNLLYIRKEFSIANVAYGEEATITLYFPVQDKVLIEQLLTELLNKTIMLQKVSEEYVEQTV